MCSKYYELPYSEYSEFCFNLGFFLFKYSCFKLEPKCISANFAYHCLTWARSEGHWSAVTWRVGFSETDTWNCFYDCLVGMKLWVHDVVCWYSSVCMCVHVCVFVCVCDFFLMEEPFYSLDVLLVDYDFNFLFAGFDGIWVIQLCQMRHALLEQLIFKQNMIHIEWMQHIAFSFSFLKIMIIMLWLSYTNMDIIRLVDWNVKISK